MTSLTSSELVGKLVRLRGSTWLDDEPTFAGFDKATGIMHTPCLYHAGQDLLLVIRVAWKSPEEGTDVYSPYPLLEVLDTQGRVSYCQTDQVELAQ